MAFQDNPGRPVSQRLLNQLLNFNLGVPTDRLKEALRVCVRRMKCLRGFLNEVFCLREASGNYNGSGVPTVRKGYFDYQRGDGMGFYKLVRQQLAVIPRVLRLLQEIITPVDVMVQQGCRLPKYRRNNSQHKNIGTKHFSCITPRSVFH